MGKREIGVFASFLDRTRVESRWPWPLRWQNLVHIINRLYWCWRERLRWGQTSFGCQICDIPAQTQSAARSVQKAVQLCTELYLGDICQSRKRGGTKAPISGSIQTKESTGRKAAYPWDPWIWYRKRGVTFCLTVETKRKCPSIIWVVSWSMIMNSDQIWQLI